MTDSKRPSKFEGEPRQTDSLAPENENREQVDRDAQAQTVAEDAMERTVSVLGTDETEKKSSSLNPANTQDVVDHMKQMDNGGKIDMSAYAGEPNHDDNVDKYGKPSKVDNLRGDGT